MNKNIEDIIKADLAYKRLINDIKKKHLTHSQLIISADEEYAENFCIEVIKEMLCQNNQNTLALKLNNGNYLDLIKLNDKKSIKVDDLKIILEKSAESGVESEYLFFLIINAEKMTIEAQNKLLKTLEEPNNNHFYFLCCKTQSMILSTIKSRCNVISLQQPPKECIKEYLIREYKIENQKALEIAELSFSNLSIASKIIEDGNAASFDLALQLLKEIKSSADCIKMIKLIQQFDLEEIVTYIEYITTDTLKIKNNINTIWFTTKSKDIEELSNMTEKGLILIYDAMREIRTSIKANVSRNAIIDKILLKIAEGKHL